MYRQIGVGQGMNLWETFTPGTQTPAQGIGKEGLPCVPMFLAASLSPNQGSLVDVQPWGSCERGRSLH